MEPPHALIVPSSPWPATPEEALVVQRQLRGLVERADRLGEIRTIGALDAHYAPDGTLTWAAAVLLRMPDLDLIRSALVGLPTVFPYVPGFLSFREAPAMLEALSMLGEKPDVLLVDGHGLAHPRRLGIACHVGVLADLPTIGVGKSRLTGRFEPPGEEKGARSPLTQRGEVIGTVLRTRSRVSPVFVSTGHRVSLETAVRLVMELTSRYRLPDPIRLADAVSRMHPPIGAGGQP